MRASGELLFSPEIRNSPHTGSLVRWRARTVVFGAYEKVIEDLIAVWASGDPSVTSDLARLLSTDKSQGSSFVTRQRAREDRCRETAHQLAVGSRRT